MSAKNRFQQGNFDKLLEDFQVLSDASFVSDEGEEQAPSPPAESTLGKQVRFNSAIAISSAQFGISSPEKEESHFKALSSISNVPVEDNRQLNSRPLQPTVSSYFSGVVNNQSSPSFKTADMASVPSALADHLPRKLASRVNPSLDPAPLPHCSPIMASLNSLNLQDKPDVSEVSNAPSCASSLDLSATDEPELVSPPNPSSLSQPSYNSVRILQEEVMKLSKNISNASSKAPSSQAEKEAFDRLVGQFSLNEKPASAHNPVAKVPVSVNFPPHEPVFVDLLEVSVSESEIVREEKEKVARRRRQILAALKKSVVEEPLPEPCPMKFFDLQQHIYQSARLHITGIPNLVPEVNGLSDDQVVEIGNDYQRSLPSYYL
uniref:Uncharacterized protein n=1 Tax=Schistocephalus solidus TaxID=70667 RepID=A0A0X3NNV7_SCHSO